MQKARAAVGANTSGYALTTNEVTSDTAHHMLQATKLQPAFLMWAL